MDIHSTERKRDRESSFSGEKAIRGRVLAGALCFVGWRSGEGFSFVSLRSRNREGERDAHNYYDCYHNANCFFIIKTRIEEKEMFS